MRSFSHLPGQSDCIPCSQKAETGAEDYLFRLLAVSASYLQLPAEAPYRVSNRLLPPNHELRTSHDKDRQP